MVELTEELEDVFHPHLRSCFNVCTYIDQHSSNLGMAGNMKRCESILWKNMFRLTDESETVSGAQ